MGIMCVKYRNKEAKIKGKEKEERTKDRTRRYSVCEPGKRTLVTSEEPYLELFKTN